MSSGMPSTRIAVGATTTVGFLLLATPAPALAQEQLNCGAYASAAVAQQQQNVQQGCGFTGPAWSDDFNGHFAWCQAGAQMADLTREDQARKDQLSLCTLKQAQDKQQQEAQQAQKIADCQAYATSAVDNQDANLYMKCGFSGGAWSRDFAGHFNWCMGAEPTAVAQAGGGRVNQLQGCFTVLERQQAAQEAKLKADCQAYADYAMCMSNRAVQLDCDVSGSRWGQVWQAHHQWCLGATPAAREAETAARNKAIDQCREPGFPGNLFGSGKAFIAACP